MLYSIPANLSNEILLAISGLSLHCYFNDHLEVFEVLIIIML